MSVYIAGDTHGNFSKLSRKNFPEAKNLTRDDIVIIAGDFGGVFNPDSKEEQYWMKWLQNYPATICFVDGNHENFDVLNTFPVVNFYHGNAHQIAENIFHLMRGEIYEIQGKTFFAFGGAVTGDYNLILRKDEYFKQNARYCRKKGLRYRVLGESYWPQECPTEAELEYAMKNIADYECWVDYTITHDAPSFVVQNYLYQDNLTFANKILDTLYNSFHCEKWFFGHHHRDKECNSVFTAVYNDIIKVV